MSRKNIGALALVLTIATGFLNLDAGSQRPRFPRSATTPEIRMAMTKQRIGRAVSKRLVLQQMANVLYSDLPAIDKMNGIKEQVGWFGLTVEQIGERMAANQKKADEEKRAFDLETQKRAAAIAAFEASEKTPAAKEELEKVEASWSLKAKLAAAAAVTAGITGLALAAWKTGNMPTAENFSKLGSYLSSWRSKAASGD